MAFDEHYEPYLKSLGIPGFVVPIILRSSETITVAATEQGVTMSTQTGEAVRPDLRGNFTFVFSAWQTQDVSFEWNKVWNMTYGRNSGIMWNNCTRESQNIIFCR